MSVIVRSTITSSVLTAQRRRVLPHADFVADVKGQAALNGRKFHFHFTSVSFSVAPRSYFRRRLCFFRFGREGAAVGFGNPAFRLRFVSRELPVPPRPPGRTSGTRRRGPVCLRRPIRLNFCNVVFVRAGTSVYLFGVVNRHHHSFHRPPGPNYAGDSLRGCRRPRESRTTSPSNSSFDLWIFSKSR